MLSKELVRFCFVLRALCAALCSRFSQYVFCSVRRLCVMCFLLCAVSLRDDLFAQPVEYFVMAMACAAEWPTSQRTFEPSLS